jgi:hypothetical protein
MLLLKLFPARNWEQFRSHDGQLCQTVHEADGPLGLILNRDQEIEISLPEALDLNTRPSDIHFLLTQIVYYGAGREDLETRLCDHLVDEGETPDSGHRKSDLLVHFDTLSSSDRQDDDKMPPSPDPDSPLS